MRHADGTLEEILHLGSPPGHTDPSWLSHLLCCPLPATLAVHIAVGSRAREQARQRRRWKRLRAAVIYKERRDRVVGSDEQEALEEAATVDAELAAEIGASVYRVGIYCSIRDPHGRAEQFQRTVKQTAAEFHALTNARVIRGRRLNLPGFTSTLPLGVDELRATAHLRAAEHRALRRADLEPVRIARRDHRRHRRPRRHPGARGRVRPRSPPPGDADHRPLRRRQDGADQRAVGPLHRPRRAHVHPRSLLHPR